MFRIWVSVFFLGFFSDMWKMKSYLGLVKKCLLLFWLMLMFQLEFQLLTISWSLDLNVDYPWQLQDNIFCYLYCGIDLYRILTILVCIYDILRYPPQKKNEHGTWKIRFQPHPMHSIEVVWRSRPPVFFQGGQALQTELPRKGVSPINIHK